MTYKTRNIINTAKNGELVRIDKRERLLAAMYACGVYQKDDDGNAFVECTFPLTETAQQWKKILNQVDWCDCTVKDATLRLSQKSGTTQFPHMVKKVFFGREHRRIAEKMLPYMYSPLLLKALRDTGRLLFSPYKASILTPREDLSYLRAWLSDIFGIKSVEYYSCLLIEDRGDMYRLMTLLQNFRRRI